MNQEHSDTNHLIETDEATIDLIEGIAHVHFKDNFEMDVPAQLRLLEIYKQITQGKPTPFMFTAGEGVSITKEARDNATSLEDESPLVASAIVVNSTAYLLIANFYLKFNKPKRPYKVFKDVNVALNWLKTFL